MKTLRKLEIDSKRLLKDEELLTLKGGSSMCFYTCTCNGSANPPCSGNFGVAAITAQDIVDAIESNCATSGTCNLTFCI